MYLFLRKRFIAHRCKWSQIKERPKMQMGHLSDFSFRGSLSLKNIKNPKKYQSVPFPEKKVNRTTLQMVPNERAAKGIKTP